MLCDVFRFGHYKVNSGEIRPGWQARFIVADSPDEAKAKALPLMDAHKGFYPMDPAEVRPAKCQYHPRYKARRPPAPSSTCGVCRAMWNAVQEVSQDNATGN